MTFLFVMLSKCILALISCLSFVFIYYHQRLTSIFHTNAKLILKFHIAFVFIGICGILFADGIDVLRFTVIKWINKDKLIATTIGTVVRTILADFSKPTPLVMITGTSYKFNMIEINLCAGLEIYNFLTFCVLYLVNLRRQRKIALIQYPLTYKYQLRENFLATSLIFPLELLHCVTYFPITVLIPFVANQNLTQMERTVLYTVTDWIVIYYVALPLLLWWRNGVNRKAVRRLVDNNLIGEKYAIERRDGRVETDKYFEMFKQMVA
ncbi:hypothetical protein L596_026179 [Steinernema carpocapsae]|uniref:7TM GPCR serpentine receptor class x (Srx) domain-containing protein n=1 Tax=Steinernema carpocapsae TaxID=34508 RepID=A0A4U5M0K7_STECR|nr:hypothetical protein L596_026179 [Steinernema carpocapsae]